MEIENGNGNRMPECHNGNRRREKDILLGECDFTTLLHSYLSTFWLPTLLQQVAGGKGLSYVS